MIPASVLLIDDDENFYEPVIEAFQRRNIALDFADSWEEGLALFRVGLHELVIADYNLPGSKMGLKLLYEIKVLKPGSRLILISGALTSNPVQSLSETNLVDRYLPKDQHLREALLAEANEADERAKQPSDYRRIGAAHLKKEQVDSTVIDKIDNELLQSLVRK